MPFRANDCQDNLLVRSFLCTLVLIEYETAFRSNRLSDETHVSGARALFINEFS